MSQWGTLAGWYENIKILINNKITKWLSLIIHWNITMLDSVVSEKDKASGEEVELGDFIASV